MTATIKPMRQRFIDLSNKRFGRWTVLKYIGQRGTVQGNYWLCRCNCGTEKLCDSANLRKGRTKSCGCLNSELTSNRSRTHGLSRTPEHRTWCEIKKRCTNTRHKFYKNYGGRGIKMCERWSNSFQHFLADVGKKPSEKHSIDRIDNDGDYQPGNVRWATRKEQSRNSRNNRVISYRGKSLCLTEWAEIFNVKTPTLWNRVKNHGVDIAFSLSNRG